MGNIELVIKIPEEIRLALINNVQLSMDQQSIFDSYIKQAIINGTLLPKGHGRLIDVDAIMRELSVVSSRPVKSQMYMIERAPTIIEADKESEDKG